MDSANLGGRNRAGRRRQAVRAHVQALLQVGADPLVVFGVQVEIFARTDIEVGGQLAAVLVAGALLEGDAVLAAQIDGVSCLGAAALAVRTLCIQIAVADGAARFQGGGIADRLIELVEIVAALHLVVDQKGQHGHDDDHAQDDERFFAVCFFLSHCF